MVQKSVCRYNFARMFQYLEFLFAVSRMLLSRCFKIVNLPFCFSNKIKFGRTRTTQVKTAKLGGKPSSKKDISRTGSSRLLKSLKFKPYLPRLLYAFLEADYERRGKYFNGRKAQKVIWS